MRHLLNTYIQADAATDLGDLGALSLTELIIKTGIHDAIAQKLNQQGKLSNNAVAEAIINNVRKTIIRDQLTDPKFYEQPAVINGASDLFVEVFGEAGKHSRTAIGVAALPSDCAVEVDAVFEIR
jgi:enamine deaminase RidA (YjgF/YER057c/UK114 family)